LVFVRVVLKSTNRSGRPPTKEQFMHNPPSVPYDVVIAGAGPVGLFLACELRLASLSVLILEQAEDSRSPLKRLPFGMRGLSAPTIEAFYRRGFLDDIVQPQSQNDGSKAGRVSAAPHWMQKQGRPGGHFAGIQFFHDNIDTSKWQYRLQSPAGTSMAVEMEYLESVLAARASAMGVEIRRGLGVEDLDQSEEDVTVRAAGETFRGRWLVGCDGGRSTVRKLGGFEFVGTAPEFTGYSCDVDISDPDTLSRGRHYTPTGMYTTRGLGRSRWSILMGAHSTEPRRSRANTSRRCCAGYRAPTLP
jgi:2-polyprenyl-6-methoxyphenol hydroxylase-like FAD-dependent oxidoreductase